MSDRLERLLSELPRENSPEIPIDALLERLAHGRRRAAALGAIGVAAMLTLAVTLTRGSEEAPVHLRLQVVTITERGASDPGPAEKNGSNNSVTKRPAGASAGQPEEFDRP